MTPLEVTVEDRRIGEDAAALAALLSIERVAAKADELPALPVDAIAPSARYRYVVTLKQDRVSEWVKGVAAKLDRPAVSARFSVNADGVASVLPGATGIRVTQDKLIAQLATDLLRPAVGTRTVAAPAAVETPPFSTEQANAWLPKIARTSSVRPPSLSSSRPLPPAPPPLPSTPPCPTDRRRNTAPATPDRAFHFENRLGKLRRIGLVHF